MKKYKYLRPEIDVLSLEVVSIMMASSASILVEKERLKKEEN